jgi:polysaccharide chain length determinant protein (PEP-CTERM system associated)
LDQHLLQYIRAIFKEVRSKSLYLGLGVVVVSFVILGFGFTFEPKYETSITIYADNKNVIKPLLAGRAEITVPKSERLRIVKETMFSSRLLEEILSLAFSDFAPGDSRETENLKAQLRNDISVTAPASNYVNISYSHVEPKSAYQVVNKLTNLFMEETAQTKRRESKSAFNFIDEQVKTYKAQLVEAENNLKSFEAANVDGLESQVNASLQRLRAAIDEISINIEAEEVRIAALEIQLSNEGRFASNDYNARVYRDRLAQLESQLDTMKLNLRDQHPDVVDLKLQIQDLKRTIVEVENSKASGIQQNELTGNNRINPIYAELSNLLAAAKVNVQTMRHRLTANENRLQSQYKRRVRVATNQAELSELTRDYQVTKEIYEDLLGRKERARISMTLDMTGQGVNYKVLEPATFPVLPTGARFLHFVIAGPIIGLVIGLGLIVVSVLFSRRILFPEQLNDAFPGIVLGVIPAANYGGTRWGIPAICVTGFFAAYSLAAFSLSLYI